MGKKRVSTILHGLLLAIVLTSLVGGVIPVPLTTPTVYAQDAPEVKWDRTFGGSSADAGHSVQQTSDGGYIVVGYTDSYGAGGDDVWLIKTDSSGNEVWDKTFGGSEDDDGQSVQQTTDGGYIIVGRTGSYGAGYGDIWLIKTDSSGNEVWDKTFGGSEDDDGQSVQQTTDGGYIIVGRTGPYGTGYWDIWLIKTDSSGNELWNKTFGGPYSDEGRSVLQTSDGGYIITGSTDSYGSGNRDVWLIKTDSGGNELWNKTFGGPENDEGFSLELNLDGGYAVAGATQSYAGGTDFDDVWLIKTDSNGNELWNKTFGGAYFQGAYCVHQTVDGGFVMAGSIYDGGMASSDVLLIRTDSNGNQLWTKTFGLRCGINPAMPECDDVGYSMQQTFDGGYVIAGHTSSYGAGSLDVWLIKVAAEQPVANQPPNQPTNASPANGATGLSLTPTLQSSTFSDPDAGDIHTASQWQMRTSSGSYSSPVYDSGTDNTNLTSIVIPSSTLDYSTTYYLHVRYQDNHGAWSSWSSETSFTTAIPSVEWSKTFGGIMGDWGNSVQQTSDVGYIIVGATVSYGAGNSHVWLIKTDSSGNELWNKTFGGPYSDEGRSVQQTSDGGYIIAGATDPYGGSQDVWLIKTDSAGNELWNETFGGTGWDEGYSVQQTSDGGYIITGSTDSYGSGNRDVWLIKTDSNGNELWNKTFGGPMGDSGNSVQQTSDGGYIIVGSTYSYGDEDMWVIKTDASGNELWNNTFGDAAGCEHAASVQQTSDNGYILVGSKSPGCFAGQYDIWAIKINPSGDELWSKIFGGVGDDRALSVRQTSDGNYVIAGMTSSYGVGGAGDVWLIKIDANGDMLWNRSFGGPEYDYASCVQQTSDGGYVITGGTWSYGAGAFDVWLLKLNDSANQPPNQPTNVSPANGATGVSLTPTLQSSAFSDPDIGDTHSASEWQVTMTSGDYSSPAFQSGIDSTNLTTWAPGALGPSDTYYWHVRHQDNHGAWSVWSQETSFTTGVPTPTPTPSPSATLHFTFGPPTLLQSSNTRLISFQPGDEIIQFTRPNLIVGTNPTAFLNTMGRSSQIVTGGLSGTVISDFQNMFTTWDGLGAVKGYTLNRFTFNDGYGNAFSGVMVGDLDMSGLPPPPGTYPSCTGYIVSTSGTGIFSGQVLIGTSSGDTSGMGTVTLRRYTSSEMSDPYIFNSSSTVSGPPTVRSLGPSGGPQPTDEFIQFTGSNISIPKGDPVYYLPGLHSTGLVTGDFIGTIMDSWNDLTVSGPTPLPQGWGVGTFTYSDSNGTMKGLRLRDRPGDITPHAYILAMAETGTTGAYAGKDYYGTCDETEMGETNAFQGNIFALTPSGPQPSTPAVTTNAATNVFSASAILRGNLDTLGTASSIDVSFQWATDDYYTMHGGNYTDETSPPWPMTSTGAFSYSLTGLSSDTMYHFRAKAVGDGTAYGSDITFTTTGPGSDGDGVPANIEDSAPNGGDGNYDGILDSQQSNVASLPNAANGGYATIESPSGTSFTNVAAVNEGSLPSGGKPNLIFPQGFFSFNINGITAGSTVWVTLRFENAVPAGSEYWKYGPTPDNGSPHWYQIPISSNDGDNLIEIPLVDGGLGDDDLTANGVIVDQGGPGNPPGGGGAVSGVPVFPSVYIGIGAAMVAGLIAYFVRRRLIRAG